MKIVCPKCNAVYNIPNDKIAQGKRARATCKKCDGKIVIEPSVVKHPDHSTQAESISTPTILPDNKPPQDTKKGEQPQLSPSPKSPTRAYNSDQGIKNKSIISIIRWGGGVILILIGLVWLLSVVLVLILRPPEYSLARILVEGCLFGVLPLGLGGLLTHYNIRKRQKSMYHPSQKVPSVKKKSITAFSPQIKNPHSLGGQVTGIVIASIIILVLFRLPGLLVILVGIFAFLDAWHSGIYRNPDVKHVLNLSPMGWGIAILLLCVLSYPLYALNRNKQKTKDGPRVYWVLTNVFGIMVLASFLVYIVVLWSS